MKKLYCVLQNGEIGIFESPTGTGKSLSIICGSLKWLKDFQEKRKQQLETTLLEKADDTEDDWFNTFLQKQEKTHQLQDAKEEYNFLVEYENKIKGLRSSTKSKNNFDIKKERFTTKRKKIADSTETDEHLSDDDFIVDENCEEEKNECDKNEKKHVLKIYYASRTHSQLAQFLGEIQRSPYSDQITVTTLGSRANFCVNQAVSKLRTLSLINEHCIELQRKKNGKSCPYMRNLSDMEDSILSSVRDIEEIVHLGQHLQSCPYYATRRVIPDVELVLLPYNILLHKPTRDAYGIVLKNNILIIDEAHNLVEAVNSMYSAEISGLLLEQTFWQIEAYLRCYKTRFSQENLRFIKLLLSLSKSFIDYLKSPSNDIQSKIMSVSDFINLTEIGNINLFELVKFSENSLIGQKLHGFTASRVAKGITPLDDQNKSTVTVKKSGTANFLSQIKEMRNNVPKPKNDEVKKDSSMQYKPSAIFNFIEFLKTLTFPTEDGRILINKTTEQSSLKFLHLNPSSHFLDVIKEARSIVLAGGTMQPVSEFTEQLFLPAGVPPQKISLFSCGHVIPPENLLALGLGIGPCGNKLDFTFQSRRLPVTVKELGSVLLNVSNTVRGGVVCFFPSYDYEEFIFSELTKSKTLQSIEKKYRVFRETKLSSDCDKILGEYAKCISSACSSNQTPSLKTGALLFSIVGGKMSEGINFSDDLGRCVIMVGLPYPNKFSVELKEKMAYLNQQGKVKNAGDVHYNNLCMKAVNQSIGRAIRHRNDYASIILLDYRYNNSSVRDLLPGWISKSLSFHTKFGTAYVALRKFFAAKTTKCI